MITYTSGNLFESTAEIWVNAVNTRRVMGKGIALAFAQRFPAMYEDYVVKCQLGLVQIGQMVSYQLPIGSRPRWILGFPTKDHWKDPSRLEYIERGLVNFVKVVKHIKEKDGISTIAMPALGCGLGGLSFQDVRQLFDTYLEPLTDFSITIYEPKT